jgi:hypothetical protein
VLRVLLVLASLCICFELSGLAAVFGDGSCSEDCPADESGGQCAPNCRLCSCCSLPRTAGALNVSVADPIRDVRSLSWSPVTRRPPTPEPRAILHVPKLALA